MKLTLFALTSLAFTFGLWWSYFAGTKDKLDSLFEALSESAVANVARDAFSMYHHPMLLGIIFVGAVIEEGIVHPEEPLHIEARVGLGVGIALFVVGMGLALKRAGGDWHVPRMILMAILAVVIVFVADVDAYVTILIGVVGMIAVGVSEHFQYEHGRVESDEEHVVEIWGVGGRLLISRAECAQPRDLARGRGGRWQRTSTQGHRNQIRCIRERYIEINSA